RYGVFTALRSGTHTTRHAQSGRVAWVARPRVPWFAALGEPRPLSPGNGLHLSPSALHAHRPDAVAREPTSTRPGPLLRARDESSLDRVVMDVRAFLLELLVAPDVAVVAAAPLPEACGAARVGEAMQDSRVELAPTRDHALRERTLERPEQLA